MTFSSDPALQSNQLPISIDFPPANDANFEDVLTLSYKRTANAVNTKEGALYSLQEVATFQQYFFSSTNSQQFRPTYRMTVNFGALPAAGLKSVAHGIAFNSQYRLTRMYGAATDPIALLYIPLPYASPAGDSIALYADSTNVNVVVGTPRANFTTCTIVLEYTKIS